MGTGETGENGVYATRHAGEVCPSEGDTAIALHQDIMAETVKEKLQREFLAISRNATVSKGIVQYILFETATLS